MASTNKTTNYELSQFIETDRPAWLTDYNGDMRTIDSTMKAISDVASGASGNISELADRMSTAEGNITTNANDIDALEARADALEAGAQSTAGTIANIQTEQTAQNLGIEAATELGYNLARPYDSASTYAVGDYVLFQNTLYKCVTAIATGEAFDPTKWLAIKATDEIAAGGYTLPTASASTLGGVKVGDGLSIDGNTGVLSGLNLTSRSICQFSNRITVNLTWGAGMTGPSTANLYLEYFKIGNRVILSIPMFDVTRISSTIAGGTYLSFIIPNMGDFLPYPKQDANHYSSAFKMWDNNSHKEIGQYAIIEQYNDTNDLYVVYWFNTGESFSSHELEALSLFMYETQ